MRACFRTDAPLFFIARRASARAKGPAVDKETIIRTSVVALALSASGLVYIANREAYVGHAYTDIAGVQTIGYGSTANVKPGDKTTPERALVRLRVDANDFEVALRRCIKVPLHQREWDAYVALAHNVGAGAFCRSSGNPERPNLIDLINAKRYTEACERTRAYRLITNPRTGRKEVSAGLQNAREREYRICMGLPAEGYVVAR